MSQMTRQKKISEWEMWNPENATRAVEQQQPRLARL